MVQSTALLWNAPSFTPANRVEVMRAVTDVSSRRWERFATPLREVLLDSLGVYLEDEEAPEPRGLVEAFIADHPASGSGE